MFIFTIIIIIIISIMCSLSDVFHDVIVVNIFRESKFIFISMEKEVSVLPHLH